MLRPWVPKIVLRRDGPAPIWLQIVHALIEEARTARLTPGTAMPGSRELAEALGVSRKTVVQAYEELVAQGWLSSEGTRGTFVSPLLPTAVPGTRGREVPPSGPLEQPDFPLRRAAPDLAPYAEQAGWLRFDDGVPDARLLPGEALARAYRRALLLACSGNRLAYGDPRGSLALRRAVATMLSVDRGIACSPDHVCLVRGTQMGIYVAARLLAAPGDTVAVESLSYPPAREAFRAAGAEVAAVGLDGEGMRLDELERLCRRCRVRAVYVTPHHQFPTTVVLRPQRRLRLLALAEQFGFAILEDDYDHEFHFAHRPLLPLASADRHGKVIYVGSFSKLLTPSLRIGYLAGPAAFIRRAAAELMIIDRQGDPVTEAAVAELIEDGAVRAHARRVHKIYAERQRTFAQCLGEALGDRLAFVVPEGGLALWVRFADGTDMAALAQEAAAARLTFLPGRDFTTDGSNLAAARLGFASLDATEMRSAIARLARALAAVGA
jgi:GntR family transcriptional regulator/MocR family aminotransferase